MSKTVIVTGCARSGLTLTMNLLFYGGYPCFGGPPAFEEIQPKRSDWEKLTGTAVKLIDPQQGSFPPTGDYVVILTKRNFKEQTKSTLKFIRAMGITAPKESPKMLKSIITDWEKIRVWAARQSKMEIFEFSDTLSDPIGAVYKLSQLIEFPLDIRAMECVVKRGPECLNEMLELQIIREFEKVKLTPEK